MVRVILAISICPIIGLLCDFIMRYWRTYGKGSREVQYPVPTLVTFVIGLDFTIFLSRFKKKKTKRIPLKFQ